MANVKLSAAWTSGATKSITAAISRLRPRSILSRKANSERANKRRADKNEIADSFFFQNKLSSFTFYLSFIITTCKFEICV